MMNNAALALNSSTIQKKAYKFSRKHGNGPIQARKDAKVINTFAHDVAVATTANIASAIVTKTVFGVSSLAARGAVTGFYAAKRAIGNGVRAVRDRMASNAQQQLEYYEEDEEYYSDYTQDNTQLEQLEQEPEEKDEKGGKGK